MREAVQFSHAALILAAVLTLAGCASDDAPEHHRWNPNGTPRNEDWHSPVGAIMKYDANGDGTLTRAELEAGLHKDFNAFDTGHTGCLTPDQVTAINESRLKNDDAAASPIIDWKNKGCVDFEEFSTTAHSLFDQTDANGDGQITPEELRPHAHHRHNPPPAAIDERSPGGGY